MAFAYTAEDHEVDILREIFGPDVRSVTFYDFDYPDEESGHWAMVYAYDSDDVLIAAIDNGDERMTKLDEIASDRDETVKFILSLAGSDE